MIFILVGIFVSTLMICSGLIFILYRKVYGPEPKLIRRVESFYRDKAEPSGEVVTPIVRDDQLSEIPFLNRLLGRLNFARNLRHRLDQAGSTMKAGDLILIIFVFSSYVSVISVDTS